MSLPRGVTIPLSPARRFVCDLMHASRQVPLVAVERALQIGDLIDARSELDSRPSWFAVFLKAYAIVAQERPPLRRSYLSFPWARLHQHQCNVGSLMIARRIGDEDAILSFQIRHPETLSLAEIDRRIRRARTEPIESISDFRRIFRMSRLPTLLRRLTWMFGLRTSGDWRARYGGTFGLTGVAALGATSLNLLSPLTTTLTYGVFNAKGSVVARLFYDHRVLDGVEPAGALQDLEKVLLGPILDEMSRLIVVERESRLGLADDPKALHGKVGLRS